MRLGATLADVKIGIAQTTVPGRMEVLTQANGAKVFIDYAHNADSLAKLVDGCLAPDGARDACDGNDGEQG